MMEDGDVDDAAAAAAGGGGGNIGGGSANVLSCQPSPNHLRPVLPPPPLGVARSVQLSAEQLQATTTNATTASAGGAVGSGAPGTQTTCTAPAPAPARTAAPVAPWPPPPSSSSSVATVTSSSKGALLQPHAHRTLSVAFDDVISSTAPLLGAAQKKSNLSNPNSTSNRTAPPKRRSSVATTNVSSSASPAWSPRRHHHQQQQQQQQQESVGCSSWLHSLLQQYPASPSPSSSRHGRRRYSTAAGAGSSFPPFVEGSETAVACSFPLDEPDPLAEGAGYNWSVRNQATWSGPIAPPSVSVRRVSSAGTGGGGPPFLPPPFVGGCGGGCTRRYGSLNRGRFHHPHPHHNPQQQQFQQQQQQQLRRANGPTGRPVATKAVASSSGEEKEKEEGLATGQQADREQVMPKTITTTTSNETPAPSAPSIVAPPTDGGGASAAAAAAAARPALSHRSRQHSLRSSLSRRNDTSAASIGHQQQSQRVAADAAVYVVNASASSTYATPNSPYCAGACAGAAGCDCDPSVGPQNCVHYSSGRFNSVSELVPDYIDDIDDYDDYGEYDEHLPVVADYIVANEMNLIHKDCSNVTAVAAAGASSRDSAATASGRGVHFTSGGGGDDVSLYSTPKEETGPGAGGTSMGSGSGGDAKPSFIRNQLQALFQPTDNKLAMKLFGSKKALHKERIRQKAAGHWIIHPCSNFR